MAWQTAAGAELAIAAAGTPQTFDEAGYSGMVYTDVGEITNIGEFGKEFNLVTHQPLATRGVKKGKGSFNNGTLTPVAALDGDDAGQLALMAAAESDDSYAFRVTLQDGSVYYMMGKVMSVRTSVGGVDDVVTVSPTIEVDSDPVIRVAPTTP